MGVVVRSFAKINLGLLIGALRPDGFHELRTVYQTIALHDVIRVEVVRGRGIEIRCTDARVPRDESNTCWRIARLAVFALALRGRVVISIDKRLPVRGGLGGASGNAVAVLLALEHIGGKSLPHPRKLEIAASVGSDLALFLVGGRVLGAGRGEEVYPVPDLQEMICLVATPDIGVSTPEAFRDWDRRGLTPGEKAGIEGEGSVAARERLRHPEAKSGLTGSTASARSGQLTPTDPSDRINEFGRRLSGWLSSDLSGVPGSSGRGRAGNPLLDLVRTGIENDFEQVVFPKYPELREVKRVLEGAGADYASLSGSGSALYGLFRSPAAAKKARARLGKIGTPSEITKTLGRQQYWKKWLVREF